MHDRLPTGKPSGSAQRPTLPLKSGKTPPVIHHVGSLDAYKKLHAQSLQNPEKFWSDLAKELHYDRMWDEGKFMQYNFNTKSGEKPFVKFMEGAQTNISYNCVDRWMLDKDGPEIDGEHKPKRSFIYRYYW